MTELKFNKGTDEEHEIKLDSHLVYATWRCGIAYAGQPASLEVGTAFVGQGSKIKIKGKSENGESLGKISDVISGNKYIGSFDIPEDFEIGDEIYFEVNLSANGLSGESNRIVVRPAPKISNMQWSAAEARRGDVLTLSADVKNVYAGTEVTVIIYEHDADGAHDRITEIPAIIEIDKLELLWEYEYHEDTDDIPTKEELDRYGGEYNPPEYFFTIKIGEKEYGKDQESGLLVFKDWIEITLTDSGGTPVANEEYILHLPDGQQKRGTLDGDGFAREEGIPPGRIRVEFPNSQDEHSTADEQSDTQRSTGGEQREDTQQSTGDQQSDTRQTSDDSQREG